MDYQKFTKGGIWLCKDVYKDREPYPILILSDVLDPIGKCNVTIVRLFTDNEAKEKHKDDKYSVKLHIEDDTIKKHTNDFSIFVDDMRPFSTESFETYIGQCTESKMKEIDYKLAMYLMMPTISTASVTSEIDKSGYYDPLASDNEDDDLDVEAEVIDEDPEQKTTRKKRVSFLGRIPDPIGDTDDDESDDDETPDDKMSDEIDDKVTSCMDDTSEEEKQDSKKKHKVGKKGSGNGTAIYCKTNDNFYVSIYAASKALDLPISAVRKSLFNNIEYKGYEFIYAEDKEHTRV